ncbi:hypothetical protein RFI_37795 [Reticulomyxa filosa]|uniref:Uncharacterized protein n=1 Tax=Reticulomyxa filosa TaxID=46433 RepID=X6LE60_RETFI|nr:hypothetical protein RFI_37795 [Reticulomyxa filosa]|eukprot:ETN99675.1 hypothetical protein RFI_37795 [Reticulomyxa filosa]
MEWLLKQITQNANSKPDSTNTIDYLMKQRKDDFDLDRIKMYGNFYHDLEALINNFQTASMSPAEAKTPLRKMYQNVAAVSNLIFNEFQSQQATVSDYQFIFAGKGFFLQIFGHFFFFLICFEKAVVCDVYWESIEKILKIKEQSGYLHSKDAALSSEFEQPCPPDNNNNNDNDNNIDKDHNTAAAADAEKEESKEPNQKYSTIIKKKKN